MSFNILFYACFLVCMSVLYFVYSVFMYCFVPPFVCSCIFAVFVQVQLTLLTGGNSWKLNRRK